MRYKLGLLILLPALLAAPTRVHAQYTFGGSPFGSGYYGGGGYYGPGSFAPGMVSPYGTVPGIGNGLYTPPWNYASPYKSGFNRYSSTILYPGFGASEQPRRRSTMYPAIPEPSPDVVAAALGLDRARIEIDVPVASAQVYLDGVLTRQSGEHRVFVTPPLNPGSRYSFEVKVEWQENGKTRTEKGTLNNVLAGKTITVRDVRDLN